MVLAATILRKFSFDEIEVFPGLSTFGWAAARMGWSIEDISCVGLHAKPVEHIRLLIAPKRKILALMRDGDQLNRWLITYLNCFVKPRSAFSNLWVEIMKE